ncbi:MAG: PEGA domain-containing protein [Candidatus Saccharibacteria bacterium]|nr:PEGA domain-containing protein [Candidatus Saccharibacteria bacterium]
MHNKKQRQRELAKRTLTYTAMTASVIILVVVSLFLVLGYTVNKKGSPEQGGLVQFRSFPTGASVSVDGAKQSFTTNNKKNASAGYHNVTMDLKQYRGWSKNFDLGSGELLWLNALLVPKHIATTEVQTFDQLSSMKISPNKNWVAVIEKPNEPKLKIIDTSDENKLKTIELAIPEIVAKSNSPGDVFKVVEWNFGSRYLLVSHISGAKTEWLRLDRSDVNNARNISVLKNINISDAHFVGDSGNVMYVLSDGFIKKIDISNANDVPKNVAENVREFELYKDDRIGYVANKPTGQVVGFYDEALPKAREIKNFKPEQPNVHSAISNYFNDDYQAISYGTTIEVIKNPIGAKKTFAKFELPSGVQWLYFSNSGRFVVAQNGSNMSVYDLERRQNFQFTLPNNPPYKTDHHLKWLDDFHFVSDVGGTLTIFEYDNTNIETISTVTEGYDASLSDNGKRMFSIGTNSATGKPVLQSSVMVVD